MSTALTLRPRSSTAALLSAYLIFRSAPAIVRLLRSVRRALGAADDVSTVLSVLAREARTLLLARSGSPPRALRRFLRALAAPDALRVLRHISAAAAAAAVRATRPPPPINTPAENPTANIDAALRAFDSPHGRRVVATVVAAATREAVATLSAPPRKGSQTHIDTASNPPTIDVIINSFTSERARPLVLDALAVAVRNAIPAILSAPSRSNSSTGEPDALQRILTTALHDRELVSHVVRTAASEAVRAYLTNSARIRLATAAASPSRTNPECRPHTQHSISSLTAVTQSDTSSQSLWRTIANAVAADARRWMLRSGGDRNQRWILF